MRKIALLTLLSLLGVVAVGAQSADANYDLNGDGNIDSLDYRILSTHILDKAAYNARYDVDGNGTIDAVDANLLRTEMKRVATFTVGGVTFRMIRVEAGSFYMGATKEQEPGSNINSYELPVHKVTLTKDYGIGEVPVTQELWMAVMGANVARYAGDNKRPVECVSWNDCHDFIEKLNELTGAEFRLPTEAEWEFAARGGRLGKGVNYKADVDSTYGFQYSGSDNVDDVAWYHENTDVTTYPVAQKTPNELGLYDMSGNVWEWCEDWFAKYSSSSVTDPKGPSTATGRSIRGGAYSEEANRCRISYRSGYYPGSGGPTVGFRLAMSM